MAIEPVDHEDIDALVRRLRLGTSASELHGSLCGYLAGGSTLHGTAVLAALQLDGEATHVGSEDVTLLDRLARYSEAEFADVELGFEPLLPADDRPLEERAEAMVEWSRGFLGGFGLGGASAHANLSEEAREVLRDLGTVAASSFDLGDTDEDEDALIEVQEFVRVAAMLLFAECATPDDPSKSTVH